MIRINRILDKQSLIPTPGKGKRQQNAVGYRKPGSSKFLVMGVMLLAAGKILPAEGFIGSGVTYGSAAVSDQLVISLESEMVSLQLDAEVSTLDHFFLPKRYNPLLDGLSTVVGAAGVLSPLLPLAAVPLLRGEPYDEAEAIIHAGYYAGTQAGAFAVTEIMKQVFKRPRPYYIESSDKDFFASMPSRHTALVFAGAAFMSAFRLGSVPIIPEYQLGELFAWGAAVSTGILRIASGKHFLSDVLAGAALGTGLGILGGWLASGGLQE